jgi:predicted amidohydrolase
MTQIGLVQMTMEQDPAANVAKAVDHVRALAKAGAQIICLPELFRSPYFPREAKGDFAHYAEAIPGETTEHLNTLSRECHIVLVGGSLYEQAGDSYYNTSAIFDCGRLLGTYRKVHIPHDPHFYEQDYFTPGDGGFTVFNTTYGRVAPLICFDQWYPEAARCVALQGADIIFYPTAIGVADDLPQEEGNWHDAWQTVQRGHAIANSVYVVAVNRVGREAEIQFWGGSFVSDPFGTVIAAADGREAIIMAECHFATGDDVNDGWGFERNRRPECYETLCRPRKR